MDTASSRKALKFKSRARLSSGSICRHNRPGEHQHGATSAVKLKFLAAILMAIAGLTTAPAQAGFRTPESLVRNVYAYYGKGSADLSKGLPRSAEIAEQFFDRSLRSAWAALRSQPYDFMVQGESWKLGPVTTKILRTEFDKTTVTASFDNNGKSVTLNFITVKGPEGWVISDVESTHDSLRMFLTQHKK